MKELTMKLPNYQKNDTEYIGTLVKDYDGNVVGKITKAKKDSSSGYVIATVELMDKFKHLKHNNLTFSISLL